MDEEDVICSNVEERGGAWKITRKSDGLQAFFPKSQVTFKRRNVKTGEATASIPLWLLEQKGW